MVPDANHRLVVAAGVAWVVLALNGLGRYTGTAAEPISVGSQSQLFVDTHLIADATGIELTVNRPKKMGRVFAPQKPWEEYRIFVESVLRHGDVYRMYYSCMPSKPAGKGATIKCQNCGKLIKTTATECPHCGARTEAAIGCGAVALLLTIIIAILGGLWVVVKAILK